MEKGHLAGDSWQQGGLVLLNSKPQVLFQHAEEHPADWSDMKEVLRIVGIRGTNVNHQDAVKQWLQVRDQNRKETHGTETNEESTMNKHSNRDTKKQIKTKVSKGKAPKRPAPPPPNVNTTKSPDETPALVSPSPNLSSSSSSRHSNGKDTEGEASKTSEISSQQEQTLAPIVEEKSPVESKTIHTEAHSGVNDDNKPKDSIKQSAMVADENTDSDLHINPASNSNPKSSTDVADQCQNKSHDITTENSKVNRPQSPMLTKPEIDSIAQSSTDHVNTKIARNDHKVTKHKRVAKNENAQTVKENKGITSSDSKEVCKDTSDAKTDETQTEKTRNEVANTDSEKETEHKKSEKVNTGKVSKENTSADSDKVSDQNSHVNKESTPSEVTKITKITTKAPTKGKDKKKTVTFREDPETISNKSDSIPDQDSVESVQYIDISECNFNEEILVTVSEKSELYRIAKSPVPPSMMQSTAL